MDMDFSLREWLIVVGVIVIVGVLVDGYRRVRSGSRGRIKMSIDKSQKYGDDERMDYFGGELPNGGARVVKRSAESSPQTAAEDKPVSAFDVAHELRPDPLFADEREFDIGEIDQPEAPVSDEATQADELVIEKPAVEQASMAQSVQETAAEETAAEETAPLTAESEPQETPKKTTFQEVEEVIVMNVFSRDDSGFNGADLMRVILACGMRYGEMDIFHREEDGADAAIQFSMANLVKPGTFDLNDMDNFFTPGVSFFLSLPGPKNSMKAFDYMYETAQCVVKNLNGELKDEMHSAMTSQTIEHSRQKVRDFERRQLSLLR